MYRGSRNEFDDDEEDEIPLWQKIIIDVVVGCWDIDPRV